MTDAELVEFAREFREGILDGKPSRQFCFMVSAPMASLLRVYGVEAEMVETDLSEHPDSEFHGHCWVRLADGRALDPTCDQFGDFPPVYLGPPMWMHGA